MRNRVIQLLTALLIVSPAYPWAAESEPRPVSVEALIAEALRVNPGLRAARESWSAALEGPAQAGALPDPKLSVSRMTEEIQTRGGPIRGKVGVAQSFPFYGKRALKGEVAARRADVEKYAYRAMELKVRSQVVRAYYDLHYLRRADQVLGEQVRFLRHFSRVAEKKYAVGRGPQAMVFRAQAEISRLQNDVITAQQEAKSVQARLNSLLNRKPWEDIGPLRAPAFPELHWRLPDLRERALKERPELLALGALEGKSEAERKLAFKRFFPDFVVGYEWTRIGAGSTMSSFDGKDAHGVTVGISLPIWGRSLGAGHRGAKYGQRAATLKREDMVNGTLAELEDLSVRVETAVRLVKVDEESILPQIRAALKSTLSGYESDSVGFLDLLDAERVLLRQELGHVRHKVMFHQLVAEIERIVGGAI
ncbi:TolC family protein [Elusimicrobiota bacterium]